MMDDMLAAGRRTLLLLLLLLPPLPVLSAAPVDIMPRHR